jgi:hypothetical protein
MTNIRLQGRQVAVEFAQLHGLRGEGFVFAHGFHQVVELGFVRGGVGPDALPDGGQAFGGGLLLAGARWFDCPRASVRAVVRRRASCCLLSSGRSGRLVRSWLLRTKKGCKPATRSLRATLRICSAVVQTLIRPTFFTTYFPKPESFCDAQSLNKNGSLHFFSCFSQNFSVSSVRAGRRIRDRLHGPVLLPVGVYA